MGNLLQAIGRAQPATQIEQYRTAITNRENESLRTEAYVQAQKMNAQRQQKELEIITNKQKQEQENQKKLDHPVSWDVVSHRFEGGAESPMFKMTYNLAKNNGLVAPGSGLGTISVGNKQKLDELMKSPEFMANMNRTRVDYWTNEVNSLAKVASGDLEAKKASNLSGKHLEEAQKRAQVFLDKALFQDKAYADAQKQRTQEKTPDIKNYEAAVAQGYKGKFNEWILDVKKAGSQNITVNTGSVGKTTQNKLEDSIISGEKNIDMLTRLDDMYNPTFLEYTGKARAGLEDYLSKVGLSKGEYLQKRAKWASEVDTFTLLWRKHITGVAGGPQEMKAIEKTVINTKYDSPAKYKAKREQMEIMTRAAIAKDKAYLANGIDLSKQTPKQREIISKTDPLSNYYPTAQKGIDNLYEKFGLEK